MSVKQDTDYTTVTKDQLVTLVEDLKTKLTTDSGHNWSLLKTWYEIIDILQILIKQNKEEEARITALETP